MTIDQLSSLSITGKKPAVLLLVNIMFVLSFFFLFVSCGNTGNKMKKNAEDQFVLSFEGQTSSNIFTSKIFGDKQMIALETAPNCLIGNRPELLMDTDDFFVLDQMQKTIFRFDRTGKFLNQIGRPGGGPGEYPALVDFDVDATNMVVEILSPDDRIFQYGYNGNFISNHDDQVAARSFVKQGTNYWLTPNVGDERLIKVSEDGADIEKFLPQKVLPVGERNFSRCGDRISFKEAFSHTVYRITEDGPVQTLAIDFGKYSIPAYVFDMNYFEILDELDKKGWANIYRFLENEQFIYIFFLIQQSGQPTNFCHWLVNKQTGNSVLQKLLADDPLFVLLEDAKALTADNQLIFMANAPALKENSDSFFKNIQVRDQVTESSNPVILSLQINDF